MCLQQQAPQQGQGFQQQVALILLKKSARNVKYKLFIIDYSYSHYISNSQGYQQNQGFQQTAQAPQQGYQQQSFQGQVNSLHRKKSRTLPQSSIAFALLTNNTIHLINLISDLQQQRAPMQQFQQQPQYQGKKCLYFNTILFLQANLFSHHPLSARDTHFSHFIPLLYLSCICC